MKTYNIHEAKTHLSRLLEQVLSLPPVAEMQPEPRLRRVHYDWMEAGEHTLFLEDLPGELVGQHHVVGIKNANEPAGGRIDAREFVEHLDVRFYVVQPGLLALAVNVDEVRADAF